MSVAPWLGRDTLLLVLPGTSESARGTLPAPGATATPLLMPVLRMSGICLLYVSSPSSKETMSVPVPSATLRALSHLCPL